MNYLWIAALCALTFMPAFVYDGILVGATLNVVMRNGMVASLAVFLAAALIAAAVWAISGFGPRSMSGSWRAAVFTGGRWSARAPGCLPSS